MILCVTIWAAGNLVEEKRLQRLLSNLEPAILSCHIDSGPHGQRTGQFEAIRKMENTGLGFTEFFYFHPGISWCD